MVVVGNVETVKLYMSCVLFLWDSGDRVQQEAATVTGIVGVPTTFAQVATGRHLLVEDHVNQ